MSDLNGAHQYGCSAFGDAPCDCGALAALARLQARIEELEWALEKAEEAHREIQESADIIRDAYFDTDKHSDNVVEEAVYQAARISTALAAAAPTEEGTG